MTIAEIIKLDDTLKDYCERLDMAINLAPNGDYEVKLGLIHAEEIHDLLESYRKAINSMEIKVWGQ